MLYNSKNYFSTALQAVTDLTFKFVTIDIGAYGKQSYLSNFRSSSLFYLLDTRHQNVPPDSVLPSSAVIASNVFIVDEVYPLLRNLVKPYSRKIFDVDREYFNMRVSRARRAVECIFGTINAKFLVLAKPIEVFLEWVDKIIECICLRIRY